MGHLKLLIGCMFSQKTTELINCARIHKSLGLSVLIINHISDTRYGNMCLATHNNDKETSISVECLQHANIQDYQVIIIDEGQFFDDLIKYVTLWADTLDVKIIVAGLSGNSNREPIGDVLRLVPHADEIIHLKAKCLFCHDQAIYSKFIGCGNPTIGSSESYAPTCRMHYLKTRFCLGYSNASSSIGCEEERECEEREGCEEREDCEELGCEEREGWDERGGEDCDE